MSRLAWITIAMSAAACGGKSPAPATPAPAPAAVDAPAASTGDAVYDRVVAYEEAICACKDRACADAAQREADAWADAHEAELRDAFGDPARSEKLQPHVERIGTCATAVGSDGGGGTSADTDRIIALFGTMAEELCACPTMDCANEVMQRMASIDEPTAKPTEAQMAQAMKIAERMAECQKKLMTADAGPPPDPTSMDNVRAPTANDLPIFLAKVKGKGRLTATIDTTMGAFHCELFEADAPLAVANFVGLATGQKPWSDADGNLQRKPFYDGLGFHRVIPGFMIQGGDPLGDGSGGPGYAFANEIVDSRRHDGPGVLSMANSGPDTNGSQFFITEAAAPWLDGKHTIFGRCKEGKLVKKITALAGEGDRPKKPVVIKHVTVARTR